jgi:hypothetical protein
MKLKTKEDIPPDWKVLTARKKTSVRIRPCNGVERFKVSWSDHDLVSDPETDLIVVSGDGREYPHKSDIFFVAYQPLPRGPGGAKHWDVWDYEYIKSATNQIVEIPEGTEPFEVETLEGVVGNVSYPDYVVIGVKGELYVNTREFVEKNLEIVD